MGKFTNTARVVLFLILGTILAVSWTGCSGGSGSNPSLPSQMPIAVEYMGETVAGDIAVPTSQTALFTAVDENGETVDPSLITAELAEPSASLALAKELLPAVSLGEFSIYEDHIMYTANSYLPTNRLSRATAQFSYEGSVIATKDINITPSLEDINANRYKFTLVYSTEVEPAYTKVSYSHIVADGLGNIYVCLLYEVAAHADDKGDWQPATTRVALKRGSYSETNGVDIEWQTDEWDSEVLTYARYCNVMVLNALDSADSATVALTWEDYKGTDENGVSELAISSDGGRTFGDPVSIPYSVYDAKIAPDGKIHMAAIDIEGCTAGPAFGIKYLLYSGGTVADMGNVNGDSCMSGNEQKPKITISSDGATAYLAWQDARATFTSPGQWIADTYLAVVNSSGTTEVKLRPENCTSSLCLAGYEVGIVIDRLGQPVVTWNEFTADGWPGTVSNIVMKTYLAVLDPQNNQATYTLLATTGDFDVNESLLFSDNSVIADYSNNYHVFFRDQQAMRYVMMRTADGQTTTPIVPISDAVGVNGHTSAATDRSGRNYVIWHMISGDYNRSANIIVGTTKE